MIHFLQATASGIPKALPPARWSRWLGTLLLLLPFVSAYAQPTTYCTTNLGAYCGTGNANISAVSIAGTSLNNPNTLCNSATGLTQWPASGNTTAVLNLGVTYQVSVTTAESGIISVWIDFNQNGTFEASEWTQIATASTAGQPATAAITIPTSATSGLTMMRVRSRLNGNTNGAGDACSTFGSGETEDYPVSLGAATACTTPPVAGTATASSASLCAPGAVTLGLTGASFGTGMTYQWQSSPNGTTWTNITGATSSTYTATVGATTQFRAVLTCSGQSANSAPVTVTLSAPTYAALPVTEGFEGTWQSICATNDAPSNSWRGTPSPTDPDASWRRDDDGASANWTGPTDGAYTPAGSVGSRSARFHTYWASSGTVGMLDLYVNLSTTGNKFLSFDFINTTGTDSLTVQVSTDGGLTFGPFLRRLTTATTWTPQVVQLPTTTSATCVIRFRGRSDYGTTDIGLDNVQVQVVTSVPNCVTSATPANNATGVLRAPTITWVAGSGVPTGYDVYFGTTATPPLVSTNQSGTSYTPTGTLAANTDYYYQIVPRNANGAATGCTVYKFTTGTLLPYCTTNLGAYCGTGNGNISAVAIANTTLNNPNTTCNSTTGLTQWPASGNTTAVLNLGVPYQVSVTSPESAIISVWIDFNQNGTFEASEWTQIATASTAGQPATATITIPTTAVSGQTMMRVRTRLNGNTNGAGDACSTFGSGETEDYILTIAPASACTAPPTAGSATASATSLCAPGAVTLSLSGASFGTGLTYQWQSSPNGTTWTNITGATSFSYTATVGATTQFRAVLTCSGQSANSAPVTVTLSAPTYAALPVTEGFEGTWQSICATNDAPSNSWRGTPSPADPDASWRRDDDGASANWTGPTAGVYTPTSSVGSRSARFHTYWADNGTVGLLDLYANLSAAGGKILTFDFINTTGADSLTVQLSNDGGVTFGAYLLRLNQAATWTAQTVVLPTAMSATSVIRFRARSDYGTTDIGIDNVQLIASSCVPISNLAVSGITATTANVTFTPSTSATTYTVTYQTGTGAPVTVTPAPTGSPVALTGLTPSTTYTVTVRANCGTSSSTVSTVTFTSSCVTPPYATLPVSENFEGNWLTSCATNDIPSASWRNTPSTADPDASFRRDDDGASANWTGPTAGAYTPTGSNNSAHSARFHTYWANSGTVGLLDLYVNLSAAGSKELSFDYINTTGTDSLTVQLSTNGGVSFQTLRGVNTAANWTTEVINLTTTSATCVIRFRGRSDYGTTDIGLDNVVIANCARPSNVVVSNVTGVGATVAFTPVAGVTSYTVTATPALGGSPVTLTVSGSPAVLTGLLSVTNYTVTVSANCGPGQTSAPVGATFSTLVAPPANDEPCTATNLPTTGAPVVTTTLGATPTTTNTITLPVSCSSANSVNDVWLAFTATNSTMYLLTTGNPAAMVRVYQAASCSTAFTMVTCSGRGANQTVGQVTVSGLTVGTRYYVAVSGFTAGDTQGLFTIAASANMLASRQNLSVGEFNVFPNPSSTGQLTLQLRGVGAVTTAQATLVNSIGQVVLTQNLNVRQGAAEQTLPVKQLATGVYLLQLRVGNELITRKVMLE